MCVKGKKTSKTQKEQKTGYNRTKKKSHKVISQMKINLPKMNYFEKRLNNNKDKNIKLISRN